MVAFSIFWFTIYWYGIFYLISFVVVYFFLKGIARFSFLDKFPHLKQLLAKDTEDIMLYAIAGVLLGGRLGYVLVYDLAYYLAHPLKVFAVHEWWMAFIGGIIWVVIAVLVLRRVKKLSRRAFWVLFDCVVVVIPLGIMLGRLWNYLNQEIYWIVVDPIFFTSGIWWVLQAIDVIHIYPQIDQLPRFNTNFIAIFFEGVVIFVILLSLFIRRVHIMKIYPWLFSWLFLVLYSFFRFFIEYLRQDSQAEFIYWLTKSQWFFIAFLVIWILLVIRSKKIQRI